MGDRLRTPLRENVQAIQLSECGKKEACFESTDHFLPLSDLYKQIVSGECRSAAASRCHVVAA